MIKEEFYRAFLGWRFYVAITLAVLILVFSLFESTILTPNISGIHPLFHNAYDVWLRAYEGFIGLIAPLVAVLPFAGSLNLDRRSGYFSHVLVRAGSWRYFSAKFLANLAAGSLALALPLVLLFAFTNAAYPRGLPPIPESGRPREILWGPLGELYRTNPDGLIAFYITVALIFGAVYASLALAISTFVKNYYLVLASPFLFYVLGSFVFQSLGLDPLSPFATCYPHIFRDATWATVFGQLGLIFFFSSMVIFLKQRKHAKSP
jgi:hypothetical protein